MAMSVEEAQKACSGLPAVRSRLQILMDLGLGYLTLSEPTPHLSGGEAQRLKLASEMRRGQDSVLFVFDEPTIGLHPDDVAALLRVFQHLIDKGATVIVIEHDTDVIQNADYIIDMGPGGGNEGGTIVAAGTKEEIKNCRESRTGRFL
jgi:excinuclease ABC subunit A